MYQLNLLQKYTKIGDILLDDFTNDRGNNCVPSDAHTCSGYAFFVKRSYRGQCVRRRVNKAESDQIYEAALKNGVSGVE